MTGRQKRHDEAFCYARTCYDHLAGSIGVQITDSLIRQGAIKSRGENYAVTPKGIVFFTTLGVPLDAIRNKKRAFARPCLDVSERRFHLAGALGTALLDKFLELKWVERIPSTREVRITQEGKIELGKLGLISGAFPG